MKRRIATVISVIGALLCASCAVTNAGSSNEASDKLIIAFLSPNSDPYQKELYDGLMKKAEESGFEVKVLESNYSQATQNQQVQQAIASGDKPAAWLWQPATYSTGIAALASLHRTDIPVFQVNQGAPPEAEEYITAYAGHDDAALGTVAAANVTKALAELKKKRPLSSPGGNVVVLGFGATLPATIQRAETFDAAIKDTDIKVLDTIYPAQGNGADPKAGYQQMQTAVSSLRGEGIDVVWGMNDGIVNGAIPALKSLGYKPGKDVMVVGGNCNQTVEFLRSGEQFATAIQPAYLEGYFAMGVVAKYLETGEVVEGDYEAPYSGDGPVPVPDEVHKSNTFEQPPVLAGEDLSKLKMWGFPMLSSEVCSYSAK